jgi:hypothetical protein
MKHENYERKISFRMCKILYFVVVLRQVATEHFVDLTPLGIFFNSNNKKFHFQWQRMNLTNLISDINYDFYVKL